MTGYGRLLLVASLALQVIANSVQRGDKFPHSNNVTVLKRTPGETRGKAQQSAPSVINSRECVLPLEMTERIQSYQPVVDRIIDYVTTGEFKGVVYSTLAEMVDTFGPRMVRIQ